MSLKHRFLAAAYHPLRVRNKLLRRLGSGMPGRLRVLLYHDIAPQDEAHFATHLRWLSQSWRFVGPNRFVAMLSGEEPVVADSLLLSFDDGFASNRRIAEAVLNPMGINALFFIVSQFAALSNTEDCRAFIAQNIYPALRPEDVPDHWRNMTWDDLSFLLEAGHSLGAHTAHHARLSQVPAEALSAEIIECANMLEGKLAVKVEHFAYTFGNLASFSPAALAVARTRFKYIYTGLRGDNSRGVPPWAIRRDAMAATDSFSLVGALLEGGADRIYARSLAEYESWGQGA